MTKQEEIREGLIELVASVNDTNKRAKNPSAAEICVFGILEYLDSQGVVIKVDRELPIVISRHVIERISGETLYLNSKTMGMAVVEPLVK